MQLHPAIVTAVHADGRLQVHFLYGNQLVDELARPVTCGQAVGLHYQPKIGDQVWVVYLAAGYALALVGMVPLSPTVAAALPALLPGETAIYGPTGRVLRFTASGGVTLNGSKAVGRVGDAVSVSGNVPSGGGNVTLTGTITAGSPDFAVD